MMENQTDGGDGGVVGQDGLLGTARACLIHIRSLAL